MAIVYRLGRATANEVMAEMEDPPSYSSVRSVLRLLEKKELVRHEEDGARHVYLPVVRRDRARRNALEHLQRTFFDDSPEQVMTTLLDMSRSKLGKAELERIAEMIARAKKEGR